jgi:hypothetical protein
MKTVEVHSAEVARLLSKIITLKSNPHYRMADVFFRKGCRYLDSTEKVLSLPEFDGTILKTYLQEVADVEKPDIDLLSHIFDRALRKDDPQLPEANELVIHIRAGDVTVQDSFLRKDFATEIRRHHGIKRCSLVICFAFQEFIERGLFLFTEEKLEKNRETVSDFISSLLLDFCDIEFNVVSNKEIDRDFTYMVSAQYFVRDVGGFSDLICKLRDYRKNL